MQSVIVIGSINNDVVVTATRHPQVGETVAGTGLAYFPGGKGANQAVASARAGAKTRMIGLVGQDPAGRDLTRYLQEAGVDVAMVSATTERPTGTALITVADGDNTIVVVPGANGLLDVKHVNEAVFTREDVVVAQFETPTGTTLEAFRTARASGATTILNPAPASQVPRELAEATDVLVVNEHEYELICEQPLDERTLLSGAQAAGFHGDVVATLGDKGVLAASQSQLIRLQGHTVQVVDSTGAGDCFVGYVAAGLASGSALESAIARANRAAAVSVTRAGAASSIPTSEDLETFK